MERDNEHGHVNDELGPSRGLERALAAYSRRLGVEDDAQRQTTAEQVHAQQEGDARRCDTRWVGDDLGFTCRQAGSRREWRRGTLGRVGTMRGRNRSCWRCSI